jgi:hypothetical protein
MGNSKEEPGSSGQDISIAFLRIVIRITLEDNLYFFENLTFQRKTLKNTASFNKKYRKTLL